MDEIIGNLSFEFVAVPQDAVLTSTSFTTPIKVKIKMKKGDKSIPRQRVISVPKMRSTRPEITRMVHSDETIMSFNIHMEAEEEPKSRRKSQNKFFHLFKTGKCLDTQGEDENDPPYMLASPIKSNKEKPEPQLSRINEKRDTINLPKDMIKTSKAISKAPNVIFGKCKPGGCLDPPFGEDNYQYYRSVQSKQEIKGKEVNNMQKLRSENLDEDIKQYKNSNITVKNSNYNGSDASSTFMIYRANSINDMLNEKFSDSIITYPTRPSSRDLSTVEKSIISRNSSSIKNKQLNIETYFTPTKIRKSQERKRESINKNTYRKNSEKEVIMSDPVSYNIPDSDRTPETTLFQDNDKNTEKENTSSNLQELVNQSNHKLSQLCKVSGNILRTINQIDEPLESECDDTNKKAAIVEDSLIEYKNITKKKNPETNDISDDKASILNIWNGSSPIICDEPRNFKELQKTNANPIISSSEQILNKDHFENDQVHNELSSHSIIQKNNLLYLEINKTSTKIPFIEEEYPKEVKNITNHNEIDTERIQNSRNTEDYMNNELPIHFTNQNEEYSSDISFNRVKEDPSHILDLNDNNKDHELFHDNKKSSEVFSNCVRHESENLKIDNIPDKNLSIRKDLNEDVDNEIDNNNKSIYSNYNNNIEVTYSRSDNLNKNNSVADIHSETKNINESNSIAQLEESNDKDSMINKESINVVPSSISCNALPSFDFNEDEVLSKVNVRRISNDNLVQDNNLITTKNMSEINNFTEVNTYTEKTSFLNIDNFSGNIVPLKNISFHADDTLTSKFINNDVTASKTISISDNKLIERIESKVNEISDKEDKVNAEKGLEGDKFIMNEANYNELLLTNVDQNQTEYIKSDTSLSTVTVVNKKDSYDVKKIKSGSAKVSTSYQDIKVISKENISAVQMSSGNTLSNSENLLFDMIDKRNNVPNKSRFTIAEKYVESDNDISESTCSSQNRIIETPKSHLDLNSNKPTVSETMLYNTNSLLKKRDFDVGQNPNLQNNKSLETKNNEDSEIKIAELMSLNVNKEKYSKTFLKPETNRTISVDLGFQTYANNNGDIILKTFDVSQEPKRFSQDKIFIKKSLLNLNDVKLSFTINSKTRLSINVDENINKSEEILNREGSYKHDITKHTYRNSKTDKEIGDIHTLPESLSAVYENDLIPVERLIKSLRLEIDRIAKYRHLLRKKSMIATKKLKTTYSKRCICTRKWNNNN